MNKFDWHEVEQIAMNLDVKEIEVDHSAPSYAEVKARSENARKLLEDGGHWEGEGGSPEWVEHYFKLRQIGFSWRVATYIAWAASPKKERWPETQAELAEKVLGLSSPRQISEWRKSDPRIDDAIVMMQAAPLHDHRSDFYAALIESGTTPDYKNHPDRKLAFEMLGDYVPRSRMDVGKAADDDELKNMTEAELRKAAGDLHKTAEVVSEDHENEE